MSSPKKVDNKSKRTPPPATTVEGREKQLVALAVDVAEKQMRDGTASSQVITHFLKLGSTTAELEKERLKKENLLLTAKTEAIKDAKKTEELFANAINAMRTYSGNKARDDEEEDDER